MSKETIRVAHSPDSDDAFMFYGLATGKIDTGDFDFVHELKDIETLNQAALQGVYEVSAVSIHGYAYLADQYALLNSGASMGDGYGPVVVGPSTATNDIRYKIVGVPGERTSAFLALKLFEPEFDARIIPFDEIIPAVQRKEVDMGLVIHEGQLTFREEGLKKIVDLGEWWKKETSLPLPLGGNVIRRDLGGETIKKVSELLLQSYKYSLENREEALEYALQFGRGLEEEDADRFVSMYVNDRTLDYGEDGRRAVQLFLDRGHQAGIIPHRVEVEFV
ncbi:MAG TPA: MqnA/MqnD/SBP family protein [Acidobacteriota bacterium]|nr:MqnA/MqnD/SBP family protein [Acidobacteriota bacterium]